MKENDFKSNESNELEKELLDVNIYPESKISDINENLEVNTEKKKKKKKKKKGFPLTIIQPFLVNYCSTGRDIQ